jgi:hypothetical protein
VSEQAGEEAHRGSVDRSAVPTGLKQHELKGEAGQSWTSRGVHSCYP